MYVNSQSSNTFIKIQIDSIKPTLQKIQYHIKLIQLSNKFLD
jgi:hypothetical protein